jgi:CSLREA domain-containing protein
MLRPARPRHLAPRCAALALLLALLASLVGPAPLARAASGDAVVNSTADRPDSDTADGLCRTGSTNAEGDPECTLRAAVQQANATGGANTIAFAIPASDPGQANGLFTISPAAPLPPVTEGATIDGLTQPGASCAAWPPTLNIQLSGAGAVGDNVFGPTVAPPDPAELFGLRIAGGGSLVRGLVINRWAIAAVGMTGPGGNRLQCSFINTDAAGAAALPPAGVTGSSSNGWGVMSGHSSGAPNIVGVDGDGVNDAAERNLISGSPLWNVNVVFAPGTVVAGNYIGTDAAGTGAIPGVASIGTGVDINNSSTGVRVGTNADGVSDALERNVIAGNSGIGVRVTGNSDSTVIAGNYIGVDATGAGDLGNRSDGVQLGGVAGVRVGTNGDGVNDDAERNVISGNGDASALASGVNLNNDVASAVIAGNYIGLAADGDAALGNSFGGVIVYSQGGGNVIGTNGDGQGDAAERNVISGNEFFGGIYVTGADGLTIAGNTIGLNAANAAARPNRTILTGGGINLNGANLLVGTDGDGVNDAAEGNLIAGNAGAGVAVGGTGANKVIAGNRIGLDADPDLIGNARDGVFVGGGTGNLTVGGDAAAERNTIAYNGRAGVHVQGGAALTAVAVRGNTIEQNAQDGVLAQYTENTGAGSAPGDGPGDFTLADNTITQNSANGVRNVGSSPAIQGNTISGNAESGVRNEVFYGAGAGPDTAGDDFLARPSLTANSFGDNCPPGAPGCAAIFSLDTAPANAATLLADNTRMFGMDGAFAEQRWYGALEVIAGGAPTTAGSYTLDSSNGGPSYALGASSPCGAALGNTVIRGAPGVSCDDVRTWTQIVQYEISGAGDVSVFTPQSVGATSYSFDANAASDPTNTGAGFNAEGLASGPFSRYQVMEIAAAAPPAAPEIAVFDGPDSDTGAPLTSGQTTAVDFGSTAVGAPVARTFTVRNLGTANLTLDPASLALPAGFALVGTFPAGPLAPNAEVTFQVALSAVAVGTFTGALSFANGDGDESPFSFPLAGLVTAAPAPEIAVFDGPDSATGTPLTSGQTTAVDFGSTAVGAPVARTFTVRNLGTANLTLDPASLALPAGFALVGTFPAGPLAPNAEVTFQVALSAAAVGTFTGALSFANGDGDESPFSFPLAGLVTAAPAPEIAVFEGAEPGPLTPIADGQAAPVDFGSTVVGAPVARTFTVRNLGKAPLTLGAPDALPAGFTLVGPFPAGPVAPGADVTFAIRLDAAAAGSFTGPVAFANGDPAASPFDFTLAGVVTAAPAPEIAVYAGPDSATGTLITSGQGAPVDFGSTVVGAPVVRSFTIRNVGTAPLTLDPASLALPVGYALAGAFPAGPVAPGAEVTFQLRLAAAAVGPFAGPASFANGDADESPFSFLLLGVVTALPVPEIALFAGAAPGALTPIADGQAAPVDFGSTVVGTPVVRSFTIRNLGTAPLTLDPASLALPAGFTLAGAFPAGPVAPGAEATFQVRLAAAASGSFAGRLAFANGDADESPFDFGLRGAVTAPPARLTAVYLPLVARPQPAPGQPDLVVTSVAVSPRKGAYTAGEPVVVTVVVTNRGAAPAAGFWVDLSVNPRRAPEINDLWHDNCGLGPCVGAAWAVRETLGPGESVTLTTAGGFDPSRTYWTGWLPSGATTIYAYADSWNTDGTRGAVLESDETNNRGELSGLTVTGQNPPAKPWPGATLSAAPAPAGLPARPALR